MNQTTPADDTAFDPEGFEARYRAYCATYSTERTTVDIDGVSLVMHPRVYRAESASTTAAMLSTIRDVEGRALLDMGCGCGVLGVFAALRGAQPVVMADISEAAVENARDNVTRNDLDDRVDVVRSDLFAALDEDRRFDLIYFNMPFFYVDPNRPEEALSPPEELAAAMPEQSAFVDLGYAMIGRFFATAPRYLKSGGAIRCSFASFGNHEQLDTILAANRLTRTTIARRVEDDYGLVYLALEVKPSA
ncbi:MAG: class I SAM-dependent methyltransferase [Myxococcota bacterium]